MNSLYLVCACSSRFVYSRQCRLAVIALLAVVNTSLFAAPSHVIKDDLKPESKNQATVRQPGIYEIDSGVVIRVSDTPLSNIAEKIQEYTGTRIRVFPKVANEKLTADIVAKDWASALRTLLKRFNYVEVKDSGGRLGYAAILDYYEGGEALAKDISESHQADLENLSESERFVKNEKKLEVGVGSTSKVKPLVLTIEVDQDTDEVAKGKAPPELFRKLQVEGPQRFIVKFYDKEVNKYIRQFKPKTALRRKARLLANTVLKDVAVANVDVALPELTQDYNMLPNSMMTAQNEQELLNLLRSKKVRAVYIDRPVRKNLAESLPLIHHEVARNAGQGGDGASVAVLDTGIDWGTGELGNCDLPLNNGSIPEGTCKVKWVESFVPGETWNDFDGHGTNVMGIVHGVAPGSGLIALKVLDGNGDGQTSWVLAAMNRLLDGLGQNLKVVAVNMSLSRETITLPCTGVYDDAIDTLMSEGIISVASSGNDGLANRVGYPACHGSVVSVGAVYDQGNCLTASGNQCTQFNRSAPGGSVTPFSNSAPGLTLLAPGEAITAGLGTFRGTSQAAPHVSGAIALLRGTDAFPHDTVEQTIDRLVSSGVPTLDPRNGRTTPRLDIAGLFAFAGRPQNVQASDGTSTDYVRVTWASTYSRFRVFRSELGLSDAPIELTTGEISSMSWDDTTAIAGKRYIYTVRAYEGVTESEPSGDMGYRALGLEVGISSSNSHTLLRRQDGRLFAWGSNDYGQLGDNTNAYRIYPVETVLPFGSKLPPIQSVAIARETSYALSIDGDLYGWGRNDAGQVHDKSRIERRTPKLLGSAISEIASFSTAPDRLITRSSNGSVVDWSSVYDLGDQPVAMASGVSEIAAGGVILLRTTDRRVKSYSYSPLAGSLLGRDPTAYSIPDYVGCSDASGLHPIDNIEQISVSTFVAAALQIFPGFPEFSRVVTWGLNTYGQLGSSSSRTIEQSCPMYVTYDGGQLLEGVKQVSVGAKHALALMNDGTVLSWGANPFGQLGNGSNTGLEAALAFFPVAVIDDSGAPIGDVVYVQAADDISIAVKSDGTLLAWGGVPGGTDFCIDRRCNAVAKPLLLEGPEPVNYYPITASSTTVDLRLSAQVSVDQSSPQIDTLTFSFEVSNDGSELATGIVFQTNTPLPTKLGPGSPRATLKSVVSTDGNCQVSGGDITCSIPNLGISKTVIIDVIVEVVAGEQFFMQASVTSVENDLDTNNNAESAYSGKTFVIDTEDDGVDAFPGDGLCDTGSGVCTLRAAIQEANELVGMDIIQLPAGNYTLSIVGVGEDAAQSGDLDINDALWLSGESQETSIIDGIGSDRILDICPSNSCNKSIKVNIADLTIQNGKIEDNSSLGGGALRNWADATISSATIQQSIAMGLDNDGGGIANREGGALKLVNCTVKENTQFYDPNASALSPASYAEEGGGIFNAGSMTLERTRVTNNTARAAAGIYNEFGSSGLSLIESSVSNNAASGPGGGISTKNESWLSVIRSTINNNTAGQEIGGIRFDGPGEVINSTISGNIASDQCGLAGNNYEVLNSTIALNNQRVTGGNDCEGISGENITIKNSIIYRNDCDQNIALISRGFNIEANNSATPTCNLALPSDRILDDSFSLAMLGDNGGATMTHALLPGNPAIDSGDIADCPSTDQRGESRPIEGQGCGSCDIGAYEAPATPTITVTKYADTNDGACTVGDCSLREAIISANASATQRQVIYLPSGVYQLEIPGASEDYAATGDLDIRQGVTIIGENAASTVIDGQSLDRIIDIPFSNGRFINTSVCGVNLINGNVFGNGGLCRQFLEIM